jgi:hypothetical protein
MIIDDCVCARLKVGYTPKNENRNAKVMKPDDKWI